MKNITYQRIINAVIVDEELTEKQQLQIINFIRKKHRVTIYEWGRFYNAYCIVCKKQLNEKPFPFLRARRLQLLHTRYRERYDTHQGTYAHTVELRQVTKK